MQPLPSSLWTPKEGFQVRALAANADEVYLGGAKGPGKTDLIINRHLRFVHVPGGKALLLRETFRQAMELVDRLKRFAAKLSVAQRPAYVGSPSPRFYWPSGHITEIGQCRTLDDVDNYMGREPWYIGYDELGNQRDERIVDLLQAEIRSPIPQLPRWFCGSGNPGKGGHGWTKRRYVIPTGKGKRIAFARIAVPNHPDLVVSRQFVPGLVWDNPVYSQDQRYLARLANLPKRVRQQLLYGDYDAAGGLAFEEMDANLHFVRPFEVPAHWPQFGGFDWGYAHPAYYVRFAMSEDGSLYVMRAVRMWRTKDHDMAERILRLDPVSAHIPIYAGRDAFNELKARRDDTTPSTASIFAEHGLTLARGNDAKVRKRQIGMEVTSWRERGPNGEDVVPRLRFVDTPEVRAVFQQWEDATEDEDDPEVLVKVDADRETGEGGDDALDACLVALASFIETPASTDDGEEEWIDPDEKERILAATQRRGRRPSPTRDRRKDVEEVV